jgi:hypothetical protein
MSENTLAINIQNQMRKANKNSVNSLLLPASIEKNGFLCFIKINDDLFMQVFLNGSIDKVRFRGRDKFLLLYATMVYHPWDRVHPEGHFALPTMFLNKPLKPGLKMLSN